jgi:hypothetical protein
VNLGSANLGNGLIFGSEFTASRVGGSLSVVGGGQNDLVGIGNVAVAGAVSAALGDGTNWIIFAGEAEAPATIGFDLTVSTGTGNDVVSIGGSTIGRNATIDTITRSGNRRLNPWQFQAVTKG